MPAGCPGRRKTADPPDEVEDVGAIVTTDDEEPVKVLDPAAALPDAPAALLEIADVAVAVATETADVYSETSATTVDVVGIAGSVAVTESEPLL